MLVATMMLISGVLAGGHRYLSQCCSSCIGCTLRALDDRRHITCKLCCVMQGYSYVSLCFLTCVLVESFAGDASERHAVSPCAASTETVAGWCTKMFVSYASHGWPRGHAVCLDSLHHPVFL